MTTTANIIFAAQSGTGFSLNVAACALNTNLSEKDFFILINGTPSSNGDWVKVSATTLQYTGTSLVSATIEIRRRTPGSFLVGAQYGTLFSSAVWNSELDRLSRRAFEYELNGIGPGSTVTVALPIDTAFSIAWNGDTVFPPTRNAVYDALLTKADLASPTFTGTPLVPTQADADNSTQAVNSAWTRTRITNTLTGSPVLGGTPTAPTATNGTNNTQVATTAFVTSNVPLLAPTLAQFRTALPSLCDGYLTLQSGSAIPTADRTGTGNAGTVYWTPDNGNGVAVWDGTNWIPFTFTELSLSLSGVAIGNHDIHLLNTAGTLSLERVAWTNDTTRATALVRQNGIWIPNASTNRRYLGTIRVFSTGASEQSFGTPAANPITRWGVWNQYNRKPINLRANDTTATWVYSVAAWRGRNGSGNQIQIVNGSPEQIAIRAHCTGISSTGAAGADTFTGIGLDSTTAKAAGSVTAYGLCTATSAPTATAELSGFISTGYHFLAALEYGSVNGVTWFGAGAASILQSGFSLSFEA